MNRFQIMLRRRRLRPRRRFGVDDIDPRLLLTWATALCGLGAATVVAGVAEAETSGPAPADVVLLTGDVTFDMELFPVLGDEAGAVGAAVPVAAGCPPFTIAHVYDEAGGDRLAYGGPGASDDGLPPTPIVVVTTAAGRADQPDLDTFYGDFALPQAAGCLGAVLTTPSGALAADGETSVEATTVDDVQQVVFRARLGDGSGVTLAWLSADEVVVVATLAAVPGATPEVVAGVEETVLVQLRSRLSG